MKNFLFVLILLSEALLPSAGWAYLTSLDPVQPDELIRFRASRAASGKDLKNSLERAIECELTLSKTGMEKTFSIRCRDREGQNARMKIQNIPVMGSQKLFTNDGVIQLLLPNNPKTAELLKELARIRRVPWKQQLNDSDLLTLTIGAKTTDYACGSRNCGWNRGLQISKIDSTKQGTSLELLKFDDLETDKNWRDPQTRSQPRHEGENLKELVDDYFSKHTAPLQIESESNLGTSSAGRAD